MHKIIIDTDIGDDIDDALAIAFALRLKNIELLGVTTVLRDTDKRSKIARCLLNKAGRADIPVYRGIGTPLVHKVDMFHNPPYYIPELMDNCEYETGIDAVDFITESVKKYPGEITLVPIGPLTNVAVFLLKNPDLKNKLKGINLMGGAFYSFYNEYNIEKDPEAAKFVFDSGVPVKAIGLDVTKKCILSQEYFDKIKHPRDPFVEFILMLIEKWRGAVPWKYPCLHDPLAVFSVFDDSILEFEEKYIDVELNGEFARCMTIPHDKNRYDGLEGYHEKTKSLVVKNVKAREFTDFFAETVFD